MLVSVGVWWKKNDSMLFLCSNSLIVADNKIDVTHDSCAVMGGCISSGGKVHLACRCLKEIKLVHNVIYDAPLGLICEYSVINRHYLLIDTIP